MNNRIFVCADLHGSADRVRDTIRQIDNPRETDIIIVAGDAGLEYGSKIMGAAKKAMSKFPGSWIVMRGNHDRRYFSSHCDYNITTKKYLPHKGWSYSNGYLYQNKYPNINYVKDGGGLYVIGGLSFLFVPGAYSVDKEYRILNGWPWEPAEQLNQREMDRLLDGVKFLNKINGTIDFVIGHTFPLHIEPYYRHLFLDFIEQSSVDKTMENFLDELSIEFEKDSSFKQYFGGHFHSDIQLTDKYTMLYQTIADIKNYL